MIFYRIKTLYYNEVTNIFNLIKIMVNMGDYKFKWVYYQWKYVIIKNHECFVILILFNIKTFKLLHKHKQFIIYKAILFLQIHTFLQIHIYIKKKNVLIKNTTLDKRYFFLNFSFFKYWKKYIYFIFLFLLIYNK